MMLLPTQRPLPLCIQYQSYCGTWYSSHLSHTYFDLQSIHIYFALGWVRSTVLSLSVCPLYRTR